MKFLIWCGGYLIMTGLYTLTYGIIPPTNNFLLWLEACVYFIAWILISKKLCKKWDKKTVEKEAFAKGMSIRQYVASVVPSEIIAFCEAHKGDSSVIKRFLEKYVNAREIPKRIALVLLEIYKQEK